MPVHQFLNVSSLSLTNFAVNRNHVSTVVSEVEILSSFARDVCSAAQNFVHSSESSVQRSEQSASYPWNCQAPPSGIHSPLAVRWNLPSAAPSGPKFNGHVFTAAPVSRFIFTHSNRFGLLVALTSKPANENELAEVSFACSQPSCHPTELQTSFRSSKLQPSFHSSQFQPSFHEVSGEHVCADS